jgi:DNA repair protein RadA/Sms
VRFSQHDVYLNVAGGYRIAEPAADLAVAAALVSSLTGLALPAECVYFGEISLSGAVRTVAHTQQRLKEAEKLGFSQAVCPRSSEELAGRISARAFQPAGLVDLVARIAGPRGGESQSEARTRRAMGE